MQSYKSSGGFRFMSTMMDLFLIIVMIAIVLTPHRFLPITNALGVGHASRHILPLRGILCIRQYFSSETVLSLSLDSSTSTPPPLEPSSDDHGAVSPKTISETSSPHHVMVLSKESAAKRMKNLLAATCDESDATLPPLVEVTGYVTAVRGFGASFCFLDLLMDDSDSSAPSSPVQAMLKRQSFQSPWSFQQTQIELEDVSTTEEGAASQTLPPSPSATSRSLSTSGNYGSKYFDGYRKAMLPGVKIRLVGPVAPTRNVGEALIQTHFMELLGLPRNPQHVRILLECVQAGCLPVKEVARAANLLGGELERALQMEKSTTESMRSTNATHPVLSMENPVAKETRETEDGALDTRNGERKTSSLGHSGPSLYALAKQLLSSLDADPNYPSMIGNGGVPYSLPPPENDIKGLPLPVLAYQRETTASQPSLSTGRKNMQVEPAPISDIKILNTRPRRKEVACNESSQLHGSNSATTCILGWVQNRRRFNGNITVLELVDTFERVTAMSNDGNDDDNDAWETPETQSRPSVSTDALRQRLKCVLHPDAFPGAGILGHAYAPGSKLVLYGLIVQPDGSGVEESTFWVTNARLVRSSWRPSVVQYVIELAVRGDLDRNEAAEALQLTEADMNEILGLVEIDDDRDRNNGDKGAVSMAASSSSPTSRQWKAAEISRNLQDENSRMGKVPIEILKVLDHFETVREDYPITKSYKVTADEASTVLSRKDEAYPTPAGQTSRWRRKKVPQLDWMAEQVAETIQSHPDYGKRPLRVLDVGGGKGMLANHLAATLSSKKDEKQPLIEVHVIDIAANAIKNGRRRSKRLQLPVRYTVGDASAVDTIDHSGGNKFDVVVALHACGALTDVALGHALRSNACFVICPCCFRSNPHLRVLVPVRHGQQNERGDEVTNISMGVEEWLGVATAKYDALRILAEVQGDITLASKAMHSICALRASTVEQDSFGRLGVELKTFSLAFSTRNICLVGTLQ